MNNKYDVAHFSKCLEEFDPEKELKTIAESIEH